MKGEGIEGKDVIIFALVMAGLLFLSTFMFSAFPPVYASDRDPPEIRWLTQTLKDGVNRFTVAIKDETSVSKATLTYTRYDAIFEEYDEITVTLLPVKGQANVYYADITVHFPLTNIEVNVEDPSGNDDSERKRFDITPTTLNADIKPEFLIIADGDKLELDLANNHPFDMDYQIAVEITGLSSDSAYDKLLFGELDANENTKIVVDSTIDKYDRNKPLVLKLILKAFGGSRDFSFNGLVYRGERSPQGFDELKGRFERVSSTGTVKLDLSTAKAVFILSPGESNLFTPSGVNLNQAFLGSSTGRWWLDTYLASDDTPIDFRGIKQVNRAIYIVDVPEPGEYKGNKPFTVLLRYYK